MSTPLAPTSPKAADAGLPGAERKYAETPAATKPAVDTIDAGAKGSSEGVLACLQSLACSVWSCFTGLFTWIRSFFGPGARDNAELLANPLKHIAVGLKAWQDPTGPMTQLLDEVRRCSTETTVEFTFYFHAWDELAESFFDTNFPPYSYDISKLNDSAALKKFTDQFIGQLLRDGIEAVLKYQKLYIDLDREDMVEVELTVKLATPVVESPGSKRKIDRIRISQTFDKDTPDSKPTLYKYKG